METITHEEMVISLAKDGVDIIKELTPESAHLLHMAVGIAGESGELCHAIYIKNDFDSIDKENVIEELGDLEFYLEGFRQGLNLKRSETLFDHEENSKILVKNLRAVKHNVVMLNSESSMLLDLIKKSAFYVKPVKINSVIDSLKYINESMERLRFSFNINRSDTIIHNIDKLGERYKGHNYSNQQAIKRADKEGDS